MAESPSNGGDDLLFRLSIDEDGQQANSPRMPPALHIESPNERESTKPLVRWEEVDERVDETKLLAQAELREQLAASMPESVPIIPPAGTNKDYDVEIIETSSPVENPSIDAGQSEKKSDVPEKSKQSKLSVSDFELLAVVGRGAYGKVFQVRKKTSGKIYAMKVLRKAQLIQRKVVKHTKSERQVLQMVRHPFIVNLRYAFQTESKLYFILDYIPGGELFTRLDEEYELSEEHTVFYAAEVLLALEHLHSKDIIYRDLKPENILLKENGHICLTDFGFAKADATEEVGTRTFCGTVHYMAPEIVQKTGHGKAADWWALGVLIYEMLTGTTPFHSKNRKQIQQNIMSSKLKLPMYMSESAKSLIKGLLRRTIKIRLGSGPDGAAAIKNHPFFRNVDWAKLAREKVSPPYIPDNEGVLDVSRFDERFTAEKPVDSPSTPFAIGDPYQAHANEFVGFSYADPSPMPSPFPRASPLMRGSLRSGGQFLGMPGRSPAGFRLNSPLLPSGATKGSAPTSPSKLLLPSNPPSLENGRHANLSCRVPAHWQKKSLNPGMPPMPPGAPLTFASMSIQKNLAKDQTPGILSTLRGDTSASISEAPAASESPSKSFKLNANAPAWKPK